MVDTIKITPNEDIEGYKDADYNIAGFNTIRMGIPLEQRDVASGCTSRTGSLLRVFLLSVDNHLAGHLLVVAPHDVTRDTKH